MKINIDKLTDTLSGVLLTVQLLGDDTETINIFDGYFDLIFRNEESAKNIYDYFNLNCMFSCDYDESQNRYLVRVFY